MIEASSPTDAARPANDISRKALVLPAVAPIAILIVVYLTEILGGNLNPHGGTGLVLILVMAWSVGAALVEIFLVPRAVVKLAADPVLRTPENIMAICCGGAFAVFVLLYGIGAAIG